jgi:membrane associated rhomboid family serine protease
VTNFLIAANLAAALAAASGLAPQLPSALARANWMVSPGGEWYRMLTSGFVHSGWIHLLVNAYALHALRGLEGVFGGRRYLAIYLLSIVAGNWLGLRQTPAYTVACGASGGVCGIVGAYVAARVANRRVRGLSAGDFSWVAQIVGLNVLVQILNSGGGGGGARIDQWGHVGGAVGGAAAALLLGPRLRWARAGGGLVDAPPLPVLLWRGGRVPPGW